MELCVFIIGIDIMKIGILSDSIDSSSGGVSTYTYNLCKNILKIDKKNNYFFLHIKKSNNELYSLDREIKIREIFSRNRLINYSIHLSRCNKNDFDLIHEPSQIGWSAKNDIKYVTTVHDLISIVQPELQSFREKLVYNILVPKFLKEKDKIIADSYCTKNDLINRLNISEDKVKVIHLGVDERYRVIDDDEISSIMRQYGIDYPFILYVGTINHRKNLPLLLKSFYRSKEHLPGHKLLCIGKMGWNSQGTIDLINQLNLADDVKIMGYIPDEHLPYFYNASDLFVFPSFYEGFGLPPLEAMACGTPVITSNTSSLPEVVGNAAIMVDPFDVAALSSAIEQCIKNDELSGFLIKRGIARSKLFDWKNTAKNTLMVYEDLNK